MLKKLLVGSLASLFLSFTACDVKTEIKQPKFDCIQYDNGAIFVYGSGMKIAERRGGYDYFYRSHINCKKAAEALNACEYILK